MSDGHCNSTHGDAHNETEIDHEVSLPMQSRRQAYAAHDCVGALRTELEYIALARVCVCVQLLGESGP